MPSMREMRRRIRSVRNIGQVTRALQAVSASKVKKAVSAYEATRPYAEKAWKVLIHLAKQPGHATLHPLLTERKDVKSILVLMITSDRGLAGASNINVVRNSLQHFKDSQQPVSYVTVGKKGRDLLWRAQNNIIAEFTNLPCPPTFMDVSAIGRLLVTDFLEGTYDQIYMSFNDYRNMMQQSPVIRKLLPLDVASASESEHASSESTHKTNAVYIYEPEQEVILSEIVPRFIAVQVYQAILDAQASEHAARMMAMKNATDNAGELVNALRLDYNKVRQQTITADLLDIAGGAEAAANAE